VIIMMMLIPALPLLGLFICPTRAADMNVPHPHQGILEPIRSAPPSLQMTADEQSRVQSGEPVHRQSAADTGGQGVAVQIIHAPDAVVWDTILSYDQYDEWVGNVSSAKVYDRSGDSFGLDMRISVLGFSHRLFTRNEIRRDQGYMAWTLDYDRKSDAHDVVGYWRVNQVQSSPPITQVEHGNTVDLRGVPRMLVNHMTRSALVEGTQWVKQRAEEAYTQLTTDD
jgi:hypothetical protein